MMNSRQNLERQSALHSKVVHIKDDIALCRVLNLFKLYVKTTDQSLAPHLMMDGFWESWVTLFCAKMVKPGSNAIDVGANLGYFAVLMGRLANPGGAVIAVEPNPDMAQLIRMSADVNGVSLAVVEAAAHDKSGMLAELVGLDSHCGGMKTEVSDDLDRDLPDPNRMCTTVALDDVVDAGTRIDFVKMDCEGAEFPTILGMLRIIEDNPDIKILSEFTPEDESHLEMIDYMGSMGFQMRILGYDSELHTVEELPNELRHLFFARKI